MGACSLHLNLLLWGSFVGRLVIACEIVPGAIFGLREAPGVCEILRGKASIEEAILPTELEGLSVIPAGAFDPSIGRELAQGRLEGPLKELRQSYDYVILDTSPILSVTDGLLIAQSVDGVLLSVRRDVSRIPRVEATIRKLSRLHSLLVGAIVIGVDESSFDPRYTPQRAAPDDDMGESLEMKLGEEADDSNVIAFDDEIADDHAATVVRTGAEV